MPRNLHENSKELEVLLAIQRQEEKEQGKRFSSISSEYVQQLSRIFFYKELLENIREC